MLELITFVNHSSEEWRRIVFNLPAPRSAFCIAIVVYAVVRFRFLISISQLAKRLKLCWLCVGLAVHLVIINVLKFSSDRFSFLV